MTSHASESQSSRQICYFALVATLFGLMAATAHAAAPEASNPLPLGTFLDQVLKSNGQARASSEQAIGAQERSVEGYLLLAPTVFATVQYSHDGKPAAVPLITYDYQNTLTYSLGISKLTTFGLTAKLSTNLYSLSYQNAGSPLFAALAPLLGGSAGSAGAIGAGSFNTTTQLELTQALWANGFGRGTSAQQDQIEAAALAASHGARYQLRASLVEAEGAYWRLATARKAVELTHENFERAQKNYEWASKRARLQLADQSDALQSQALLEVRKLEYQRAQDDERTASRGFNSARQIDGDAVAEKLDRLEPEQILAMQPPKRAEQRDDVKAAAEQARAVTATAEVARERDRPTLDLFASAGLNGRDTSFGTALGQAFGTQHPAMAVGINFHTPIALFTAEDSRSGYKREQIAADLIYQRKVYEQEQTWRDLNARLEQAKQRLKLAVALEKVQQSKLHHERSRYSSGRSTSFQVLTFESDFGQSELVRIQSETEVLALLTQMKLYSQESQESKDGKNAQ